MSALNDPTPASGLSQHGPEPQTTPQGPLSARLEQLAAKPGPEQAEPAAATTPLDLILAEIDSIMLPREVTMFCGADAVARLVISQRRLVGLALADGWRGDLIDGVRRLLQRCGAQAVTFQRSVAQAPIGAESLSADMIRARLGVLAGQGGSRLVQFQNESASFCSACLELRDDGEIRGWGADEDRAVLERVAQNMAQADRIGLRARASIIPFPMAGADQNLLVARAERQRFLALVRTPALADVVTLWQRVFEGT